MDSSVSGSVSVRKPSSNWLGVMRSACGHDALAQQHRDRGVHEAAGCRVAHDRVAGVDRRRVGGLDPRDGVEDDVADLLAALVAGEHGVDLGQRAALLDAGDDLAHVVGGDAAGRARRRSRCGCEKCTVWTGHTSTPRRCSGKTAAELPTWP